MIGEVGADGVMKVLVVEDVELNRFLMYELLSEMGHNVILCSDGQEALQILIDSREPIDLIFMDIHMPIIDGITATKEIRKMEQYLTCPIIVLTSDVLNVAGNEELEQLFNGYLLKPINKQNIEAVLTSL